MNSVQPKSQMPAAKLAPEFMPPAETYADATALQASLARRTGPSAFKVRGQLLDQGRTDAVLAASEHLTVRLKMYASGGENNIHAHPNEDHVFIILQGSAEFHDPDGVLARVGPYEGVMLPKGSRYNFTCTSKEPLVMLRVGGPNESAHGQEARVEMARADGKEPSSRDPVIFRPGAFFG